MSQTLNNIFILSLVLLTITILCILLFSQKDVKEETINIVYGFDTVSDFVKNRLNEISNINIAEQNLTKEQAEKKRELKANVKQSIRLCGAGDIGARSFLKSEIKRILIHELGINEITINHTLPFESPEELRTDIKLDILIWFYSKEFGKDSFQRLIRNYHWDAPKTDSDSEYYEIREADVEEAFQKENPILTFQDKLEILAQRIYEKEYGNSVIDRIRNECNIDGVSGGVGGIPQNIYDYNNEIHLTNFLKDGYKLPSRSYDHVACMYHGKTIHVSALTFGSERELERVTKNIYRNGPCGHLSQTAGYKMVDDAIGNRVVAGRPNYTSSWGFLVRKLDNLEEINLKKLYYREGIDELLKILFFMVRGMAIISINGETGSGKTTLLKGMVGFLPMHTVIRSLEKIFELHLSSLYPERFIWELRETPTVSAQNSADFGKKLDTDVFILGEVSEQELASITIQLAQTGTKMTMTTSHCVTTEMLIDYYADSLIICGAATDTYSALQKASRCINIDIHMARRDGIRYVERITEIIPYEYQDAGDDLIKLLKNTLKIQSRQKPYYTKDILLYENGRYVVKNRFSEKLEQKFKHNMSAKDWNDYETFFKDWERTQPVKEVIEEKLTQPEMTRQLITKFKEELYV